MVCAIIPEGNIVPVRDTGRWFRQAQQPKCLTAKRAADPASELPASITQPKRIGAWHPQRPAARPAHEV